MERPTQALQNRSNKPTENVALTDDAHATEKNARNTRGEPTAMRLVISSMQSSTHVYPFRIWLVPALLSLILSGSSAHAWQAEPAPTAAKPEAKPAPAESLPKLEQDTVPAKPARPNLVLIIADDQAWTDFGFMGHPVVKTPAIDALAAKSARFDNGYVPTSLCRASLATLLTGQYAHQHMICFNDPPRGFARDSVHPFIARAPALPRILATAGYRGFQTGKFWEGHYANAGFTDGMTVKGRHGDTGLVIGRTTMEPIAKFIDDCGETPFFVWYAPMLPHLPHNPSKEYLDQFAGKGLDPATQAYYATIKWFDDSVAALMKMLEDRKKLENTAVLFIVDNGWAVPQAGQRAAYGVKSKNSPFEGGLRTPVLLSWPGHTEAKQHEDLVSSLDVVPTLLDIAGLDYVARGLPGMSLAKVATGKSEKLPRDRLFGELYLHTATKLGDPEIDTTYRWVRRGDWKLILPTEVAARSAENPVGGDPLNRIINPTKGPFLYDVKNDPHETKNLADDPSKAGLLAELTEILRKWSADR